jgi:hypothetical protein
LQFNIARTLPSREILSYLCIVLLTLAGLEIALRIADFRELRDSYERGRAALFRYDSELGWAPIPNSTGEFTGYYRGSPTIHVQHNHLGLRDIEHDATSKPTIAFLGDSFVWGYNVEAKHRFTEVLRADLPDIRIVNVGVPGYGTDQEYLLLQRLWNEIRPDAVVLMIDTKNSDFRDNSTNVTSGGYYKPYLKGTAAGDWRFSGLPVPWSRHVYVTNPVVRNLWLARLAVTAFVVVRHPKITVSDPTQHLIGMLREFVEARGASVLAGLLTHDPQEAFLKGQEIPYTSFDDAPRIRADPSGHWTPEGHALVASRLMSLFEATDFLRSLRAKHERDSLNELNQSKR